jgi:hypothetical protein
MWVLVLVLASVAIIVGVIGSTALREADSALVRADPSETYDPVRAGEPAPDGFRQLLARDQIAPVYEPIFTSAGQVDWPPEMLVIGVSGTSESKAYPVTHLNQREMVLDYIDGEPILVSW